LFLIKFITYYIYFSFHYSVFDRNSRNKNSNAPKPEPVKFLTILICRSQW